MQKWWKLQIQGAKKSSMFICILHRPNLYSYPKTGHSIICFNFSFQNGNNFRQKNRLTNFRVHVAHSCLKSFLWHIIGILQTTYSLSKVNYRGPSNWNINFALITIYHFFKNRISFCWTSILAFKFHVICQICWNFSPPSLIHVQLYLHIAWFSWMQLRSKFF